MSYTEQRTQEIDTHFGFLFSELKMCAVSTFLYWANRRTVELGLLFKNQKQQDNSTWLVSSADAVCRTSNRSTEGLGSGTDKQLLCGSTVSFSSTSLCDGEPLSPLSANPSIQKEIIHRPNYKTPLRQNIPAFSTLNLNRSCWFPKKTGNNKDGVRLTICFTQNKVSFTLIFAL